MEMGRHPRAGRIKGERRLFSRTGDDISGAFPMCLALEALVLDGELLVMRTAKSPFNDLQQRLNRKP
jgi:DNA ligase-1